jgi:hypothetical protein
MNQEQELEYWQAMADSLRKELAEANAELEKLKKESK